MLKQGKLTKCYTPYVQQYVVQGSCGGYLGHGYRTDETDRLIEQAIADQSGGVIRGYSMYDLMGRWLCSTFARYTMDLLPTIEDFKDFISDGEKLWQAINKATSL